MGRGHIPNLQRVFTPEGNVVGIDRLSVDVLVAALVRGRQGLGIGGFGQRSRIVDPVTLPGKKLP